MTRILVYLANPPASDVRIVERALGGSRPPRSIAPVVSAEIASQADVVAVRERLRSVRFPGELFVVETDFTSLEGIDGDAALRVTMEHPEWRRFVEEAGAAGEVVTWSVSSMPWCWVVVVRVARGIPPGLGFLVDRRTGQVMVHRYIDVMDLLERGEDSRRGESGGSP